MSSQKRLRWVIRWLGGKKMKYGKKNTKVIKCYKKDEMVPEEAGKIEFRCKLKQSALYKGSDPLKSWITGKDPDAGKDWMQKGEGDSRGCDG